MGGCCARETHSSAEDGNVFEDVNLHVSSYSTERDNPVYSPACEGDDANREPSFNPSLSNSSDRDLTDHYRRCPRETHSSAEYRDVDEDVYLHDRSHSTKVDNPGYSPACEGEDANREPSFTPSHSNSSDLDPTDHDRPCPRENHSSAEDRDVDEDLYLRYSSHSTEPFDEGLEKGNFNLIRSSTTSSQYTVTSADGFAVTHDSEAKGRSLRSEASSTIIGDARPPRYVKVKRAYQGYVDSALSFEKGDLLHAIRDEHAGSLLGYSDINGVYEDVYLHDGTHSTEVDNPGYSPALEGEDADREHSFTPSHSNSSNLDPTDFDELYPRETHSSAEDGDVDEDANLHDSSHLTEPFDEGLEEGNYHLIRSSTTSSQSTVTSADGIAVTHDPDADCEPYFTPSHSNSSDLDPTDLDKRCPRETHSSAEDGDVNQDTNLHDGSHSTEQFDEGLEERSYHLIRSSTTSSQSTVTSVDGIAVTHDPDADCEPYFTPSHSNSSDLDPTDLDKRCQRETYSSAEDGDVDEDTNLHDGSHSTEPFDECLEEGNYHLIRLSTTSSQYTMTSAVGIAVTHDPDADCEPSFTPSHSNSSDLDPTDLDKRCARETHSNAEDGDVDEDTNLHDGSHSTEPFDEGLEEGNYHVIRSSSTLSQSTVTSADGFAVTHDPGAEGRMVRSEASSTISRDARPSRCVKAKYAYLGDVDNALSFEKGDLLHVIRDEHADWLLGYSDVNKQYGLIPRNRVDYQEGPEPCLNRRVDAPDNCLEVVTATGGYAPDPENVYQLRLSEGDELHVVRHDYPGKWLVVYNTRSQEYGISHFNLLDENLARGTYHVTKENEMVALFSFTSRTSDEISLEKGDLVSAVHDSGYWLKVRRNVSQKAGLVPQHYVARVGSLDTFEWFHGVLSVTGSVQRLNEERNSGKGTFLVRLSETRTDGYTISLVVKKSADVMHYPIEKDNRDATFSCDGKVKFISLELLVDHYSKSDQDFLKCPLGHCCEKPLPPVWEVRSGPRDEWELPQGCLKMLEKIGSGNFGIVYLGKWFDERDVAIKVLKEGAMAKSEFRDEADVMKNLHHENILKLIGVCSEDEPLMIVTQYIENGSLDKFLQKQENRDVTLNDLMLMAHHIVMGMAYMESMKYIHRDLGARNILVGDDCVMKIADFGLARLIKDNEYLSRGMTFPIKWTAPEAIHNHRFSVKSDVWSFGIVLVEMLTEGATPYPNVSKERVTDLVLTEYRHPKPNKCSYKLYDIMLRCWEADPSLRPSFEE